MILNSIRSEFSVLVVKLIPILLGALVFVVDAQDEYTEALQKLHVTIKKAHEVNPKITFSVFIHKVDGLAEDHKIGNSSVLP